jgi:hypothetical protein
MKLDKIVETLVNEMNKLLLIVRRLGKTSYPDIEISQKQLSKKQSTLRYFYCGNL